MGRLGGEHPEGPARLQDGGAAARPPALSHGVRHQGDPPGSQRRQCRGIFDEQGRLLVVINWNTDLGDAWEWAENPYYPLKYSTFAYQMGINFIVYSMSH